MPDPIRRLVRVLASVAVLSAALLIMGSTAASAAAVPTVVNVSPDAGPTTGGTAIFIDGTGFVAGATVVIGQGNGTTGAIPVTEVMVVSSTEITAVTGGGAKVGTWTVYVTTSGGTSAANSGAYFSYDPVPTISKVSPDAGPTYGGTAITITGTGFVSGQSTVVIGQGSGTTEGIGVTVKSVTSTTITGTTNGGAKVGTWNLFVTTPGGTNAANSGDYFTYGAAPTVSKVSPNSGPTSGGTAITITGTGFVGATVVIGQGYDTEMGAIPATAVMVVSSTEITAVTGGGAKAGTWNLFVITTTGGASRTNSGDYFTYS